MTRGTKERVMNIKGAFIIVLVLLTVGCAETDSTVIKSSGIVDGDVTSIKTQVAGAVKEVLFSEGEEVAAGEVLAEVDREKLEKNLEAIDISEREIRINRDRLLRQASFLKENISYLTKQTGRLRRLKENAAVSGDKLEAAELRLLEAQTSLEDV